VQQHQGQFAVAALCRVMGVPRSGYYAWRNREQREPSARQKEDEELLTRIRPLFERSKQTYGSPRILRDLKEEGFVCGKHRIARLMRHAGLRAVVARRFRATTDSKHVLPVAENRLDRDFTASAPNRKWAGDITYLWTGEGWLYLAVVLDLFSRRVVGWCMQANLERSLVSNALEAALLQRRPQATGNDSLLHHSDRGSQYASHEFQEQLDAAGIVCSMSRRGNCWDNAPVESFFGTLKQELVNRHHFPTRERARKEVFEYIEVWYNRQRRHSSIGYVSPEEFERRALITPFASVQATMTA
jgi:transposase InsO family protein